MQGQAKGLDRAFQTFEQVDRHQALQGLLTVCLTKSALSPLHIGVIHGFVLGHSARQYVTHRRIHRQTQARELLENFIEANDPGMLCQRRLKRQGFITGRKTTDILGVVEGLNMPTRAGNGDAIEQSEEVEIQGR